MVQAGILTADDRVELLEGWLVAKMTKNPPHRIATRRTRVSLESLVGAGWYVDTQEPVVTADSEPEPDVAVIRGKTEDYADHNPGADRVGLVVEIADVTLLRDRRLKTRIYGHAGIPVYWILNLIDRRLEVFTNPTGASDAPGYGSETIYGADQQVPLALDGVELGRLLVHDLLP
jgi:Uma2 family endonuclease